MDEQHKLGPLLIELGFRDEVTAAAELGISEQTLTEYRKAGVGPEYAVLARKVIYSKKSLRRWLLRGAAREGERS
jgi:hypothetical protein